MTEQEKTQIAEPEQQAAGHKATRGFRYYTFKWLWRLVLVAVFGSGFWSIYNLQMQQKQQAVQWEKAQAQQQRAWHLLQKQLDEQIKPFQLQLNQVSQQLESVQYQLATRQPILPDVHLHVATATIHMAQWLLNYQHETSAALGLLQELQHYLQISTDPLLEPVRKALANDLIALQTSPNTDRMALVKQIQWLIDSLPKLRLKQVLPSSLQVSVAPESLASGWRYYWQQIWQQLQKVVVIRDHDRSTVPLLFSKNRSYADQQLQFLLQQAQWAALHGNGDIYQLALEQAMQWLQSYFAPDHLNEQTMQPAIEQLLSQMSQPGLWSLQHSQEAIIHALKIKATERGALQPPSVELPTAGH